MKVGALFQDVTRVEADLLVAPLWSDVRPPRGVAGKADWYLCGFLSRLMREGRLSGRAGETVLVALQGRFAAPRLLVLGAGARAPLAEGAWADFFGRAAETARGLGLAAVAAEVPPAAPGAGPHRLVRILEESFSGTPVAQGELQILCAAEDEAERWRRVIREGAPSRPGARAR